MFDGMYFPCMTTKAFEFLAYEKSENEIKDRCLPVVTLTRHGKAETFEEAIGFLSSALQDRPAIVDFDPTPTQVTSAAEAERDRKRRSDERVAAGGKPIKARSERQLATDQRDRERKNAFNAHLQMLGDPDQGAISWISIIANYPALVPAVRLTSPESISAQIALSKQMGRRFAVRVRLKEAEDVSVFLRSIPVLADTSPRSWILLVDAGYVRNRVAENVSAVNSFLARVRAFMGNGFQELSTVLLSNSFPKDSLKDYPEVINMAEVALHKAVSSDWKVGYGDYMSVAKRPKGSGSNGWYPHVDLVETESWRIRVDPKKDDPQGFVRQAGALIGTGEPWRAREICWGTQVIEAVSGGTLKVDDISFTVPGPWLSVRANQHLARMARR